MNRENRCHPDPAQNQMSLRTATQHVVTRLSVIRRGRHQKEQIPWFYFSCWRQDSNKIAARRYASTKTPWQVGGPDLQQLRRQPGQAAAQTSPVPLKTEIPCLK
jgi:hypothetical protein